MAYPIYDQMAGSRFIPVSGHSIAIASHGGASSRNHFGAYIPGRFDIRHIEGVTNKDALLADYNTNRTSTFSLAWDEDGTTHTVFYAGHPQVKQISGSQFQLQVDLIKVKPSGAVLLESGDYLLLESGDKLLLESN